MWSSVHLFMNKIFRIELEGICIFFFIFKTERKICVLSMDYIGLKHQRSYKIQKNTTCEAFIAII